MPRGEIRTDRVVAGVVFSLLGTAFLLDALSIWHFELVLVWPVCLIAVGVAIALGRVRRQQVDETRRAQLAVAEERLRIARDLHDIVAHGVSLMTIQIAAARRVATTKPAAADEALRNAEDAGRKSLAELRDLVSVLRSADDSLGAAGHLTDLRSDLGASGGDTGADAPLRPLPGLGDIDELVEGFRAAGLDVTYGGAHLVAGDPGPRLGLTVYRIVQEALTNSLRHAGPTSATVEISDDGADLTVIVTDEGPGASATTAPGGGGHGLVGMRERAAAAAGTLEAGPRRGGLGWRVTAVLPLNGGA